MDIITHQINQKNIAEIRTVQVLISDAQSGLDLLGNMYYQGFDGLIIYEENIAQDFFDLSSGLAGEVLQKFSNYRMQLAIIGNFEKYNSKSLNDFIRESNAAGNTVFTSSLEEALIALRV